MSETYNRAVPALRRIETTPFDALVVDIVMPGMMGLELARQVRRLRPDMSVIVMTGFIEEFSYDEAIEAGASDFIKKPFSVQELLLRVKHVKMQEKLRTLSITDELTGLPNRRGFFAFAAQQMKMVSRTKRDLALLFADLDNLKAINDTGGHQEGDAALAVAADIFRRTFRESDIIARMGGDEFAILLIDAPEKKFSVINDRLQKNIEAHNAGRNGSVALSISIGMAVYDHDRPSSLDELLKQADARMYEQKQRKGNSREGEKGKRE
jgi:diguanylate cyclase (GGDEF)-like protein